MVIVVRVLYFFNGWFDIIIGFEMMIVERFVFVNVILVYDNECEYVVRVLFG